MVNIESYLNDGANWQARGVFAYIYGNYQTILGDSVVEPEITVGRFENFREQGYVFTLCNKKTSEQLMHYAVYEHRISDSLIVLKKKLFTFNTPNPVEMFGGRTKFQYDKGFDCGEIKECAEWILDDMLNILKEIADKN